MSVALSLRHRFPGTELALQADLGPGVTAIFGPSGAGKTTILRMVAGLLTPDEGRIEIDGRLLLDTETGLALPPAARRVAYVFQEPRLFPHLNVAQNLRYGMGRAEGRNLPLGFDDLVALLGLGPLLSRRPATLSGGEGQRVALGRALLSGPELLLMDEPLSALDQRRKQELLPYFERLRDQTDMPILYVSHDVTEVARLADTVILLDAGRVTAIGPAAQVFSGGETAGDAARDVAGGLLAVTIADHDEADGLTQARIGEQHLWLPGKVGRLGENLRLRIDASDVMLMLDAPQRLSALNVLPASVIDIRQGPGSGALVRLDHQGQVIVARLTRRSVRTLGLAPGTQVHAVLKSMAVSRGDVGGA